MALATLAVELTANIAQFRAEFQDATRQTQKFQQEFQTTATKASAMGNLIARGVEQVARAAFDAGKALVDNAGKMVDLANKTGLTTDSIQEFQAIAEQTGSTVDAFANAAFRLGSRLAGGSDSVRGAVEALGLSFENIRRQSPDEQFRQIVTALSNMDNAQERNRLGLILFDRTFAQIASAVNSNYQLMADGAVKASRAQLEALDAAGEAWDNFARKVQTQATAALGSTVVLGQSIRENLVNVFARFAAQGPAGAAQEVIANFANKVTEVELATIAADKQTKQLGQTLTQTAAATDRAADAGRRNAAALREQEAEARRLASIRSSFTGEDQIRAAQDVLKAFQGVIPLQQLSAEKQAELNKLYGEAIEVAGRLGRDVPQVWADIFFATIQIPPAIEGISESFARVGEVSSISIPSTRTELEALNFTVEEGRRLLEGYLGVVAVAPSLFERMFGSWQNIGTTVVEQLAGALNFAGGDLANRLKAFAQNTATQFAQTALSFIPGIGPLLSQFAGPIIEGLKNLFGSIFDRNRGRDLIEDFAAGFGGFDELHRQLQATFDDSTAERFWIMLTQGVGRNNPDQARRAIETVTAAIEEQKRKQQEAANAAVETSQAIQESQDAATEGLRSRLSELSSEYDRLFDSIKNEAPEEVMGVVEQQTRARMEAIKQEQVETQNALDAVLQGLKDSFDGIGQAARDAVEEIVEAFRGIPPLHVPVTVGVSGESAEVPELASGGIVRRPTLALVGEAGPEAVVPLSQFAGMGGGGSMDVTFEIDGYIVAKKSVPYIPGAVKRYIGR